MGACITYSWAGLKSWTENHQLPECGDEPKMNQSQQKVFCTPYTSWPQLLRLTISPQTLKKIKRQERWSKEGVQEGTDRQRIVVASSLVEPYEQGCKSPVSLSSSLWPTDHWWDILLRHIGTSGNNSRFLNLSKRGWALTHAKICWWIWYSEQRPTANLEW